MSRLFLGWDKESEKNYNRIFRKSKWSKIKEWWGLLLLKLLIGE